MGAKRKKNRGSIRQRSRKTSGNRTRKAKKRKKLANRRAGRRTKKTYRQKVRESANGRTGFPTPTQYCLSTWDWAAAQSVPLRHKEIYSSHTLALTPPIGIDEQLHNVFRAEQFYSPPPYVAEIPNGRVWGEFGAVITPDNKLLWDVSIFPPMIPSEHHIFRQPILPPLQFTEETVAVLTFCASSMYYHWMFDVVSRLDLLNKFGMHIDRYIVNGVRPGSFQEETLERLGIPKEKRIHCSSTFHLQAKTLIVPAAPAIQWGPHNWQIQFLREEFLMRSKLEPIFQYERIYISRSLASNRRVKNEEQLYEILRPLGFAFVHLETFSVLQQAQIFSSAKIIVAPHGSGLTNLTFCQPGTKVIELFSSNYPVYVFWLICNHLKLDYYYLFGEGERAPDKVDPERGYDDMVIDIEKFAEILKIAGIRTSSGGIKKLSSV